MPRVMSRFGFRLMAAAFKIRDWLYPRAAVLQEAGIEPGARVLDYGCGPGSYIAPLAELVGQSGQVYALDVNPLAAESVRRITADRGLSNVTPIESDCGTGLPDESLDVVLMYDVFHHLPTPDEVLRELHRVLKPGGLLSFSDHHMKEDEIMSKVTAAGLFSSSGKGSKTYSFVKESSA